MNDNNKQNITKGELLDYGHAPYQDNPQNTTSYFVQLRHDNGVVDKKWGVDLERAIQDSGVQKGDTVILNDLGKQSVSIPDPNDPSKSKTVNKGLWELEKYEPVLDLPNTIEHDSEREQQKAPTAYNTKQYIQNEPNFNNYAKNTPNLSDFEFELPSNIKNNYIAITKNRYLLDQKTNYYDKNDKDQVNIAFEDRSSSLHTSRQDEKTIHAMLDMAQSKNWTAIKLKGTEEFKQKAWLEASLRGIEVKGYTPTEKDLAELQVKQQARTTNQVEMTAQKAPEFNQQTQQNEKVAQEQSAQEANQDELNTDNQEKSTDYKDVAEQPPKQEPSLTDDEYSKLQDIRNDYLELLPDYYRSRESGQDLSSYAQPIDDIKQRLDTVLASVGDVDFEKEPQKAKLYEKLWDMRNNAIPEIQSTIEQTQKSNTQKTAKEIKNDIRQIFQAGYKDGSITSRDELVATLKERGFEIKENEKSIRVSLPNQDKGVNLSGEVFTKDYDAIKSLKERLEPDTLKQTYPSLTNDQIVHITAFKNKLFDDYKDSNNTKVLQASLVKLEDSTKDMAQGKEMNLPSLPINEIKPDVEVRTTDNHDKSRQV